MMLVKFFDGHNRLTGVMPFTGLMKHQAIKLDDEHTLRITAINEDEGILTGEASLETDYRSEVSRDFDVYGNTRWTWEIVNH